MINVKKVISEISENSRLASKQVSDGLAEVRDLVRDLKRERKSINTLPVLKEEAKARAEAFVVSLTEQSKYHCPSPLDFARNDYRQSRVNVTMLVSAFLADNILAAMQKNIDTFYETSRGVGDDERQQLIRDVDRRLLDAELAEESIIRSAETSGFPIFRRRDADPRAVLAHDEVLP